MVFLIKKLISLTYSFSPRIFFYVKYMIFFTQFRKFFITYSQTGEDIIIRQFLPENTGSYLDIGSGDPIIENNTYSLYKRGWSGILIDPIYKNHEKNRLFRKRDASIQKICSDKIGVGYLQLIEPYQFSYVIGSHNSNIKIPQSAKKANVLELEKITIESLNIRANPKDAFLLSIDAEGSELEIITGINWIEFKPRLILIEQHLDSIFEGNLLSNLSGSDIYCLLIKQGYKLISFTGLTSLYVHNEYLISTYTDMSD